MLKIAGHTMGTPEYSVPEALALFREIGLDGAEIVVQDNYHSGIPDHCPETELTAIRRRADELGLRIVALTPYFSRYNSLDDAVRREEMDGLRRIIDYARILDADYIRIYGGNFVQDERDPDGKKRRNLVESLRILGDDALAAGKKLVVENHFNTMTVSAAETASVVAEIDHPAVGILYDQANLAFTYREEYEEAIPLQADKILYVHVKDLRFKGEDRRFAAGDVSHQKAEERNVVTKIVGEGILDWAGILALLAQHGYTDGWLSLEYERRWHPQDIPDAAIGMRRGADHLKKILGRAETLAAK